MPNPYYTAITRQVGDAYEVASETIGDTLYTYAEHFADEVEAQKRFRQFESQAAMMDAKDDGSFKAYLGTEPVESLIVRLTTKATDAETPKEGDDKATLEAKAKAYQDRVNALADKAGAKTVSRLEDPEIDDREEARPVPAIALARSAVEVAEQAVKDARAAVDKHQGRAGLLADEATNKSAMSAPPDVKAELRRKANDAQGEAEQAKARLYHAEQELKARQDAVAALEAEEVNRG